MVANPKHLQFRELEAAQLPRALDDVDLALSNTNSVVRTRIQEGSFAPNRPSLVTSTDLI